MRRIPAPAIALALSVVGACASGRRPHGAEPPLPSGCHPDLEPAVLNAARNALADRRHENRFNLPWTDTLPPTAVRDDVICRRAAAGYAGGKLPRGVPARATVVRAGGLYFVVGPTDSRAGEFLVVGVLDASFRWITGLTT
jgi:hypothetical protein